MSKSLSIIAAVLAGLALAGCASPWTADKPASTGLTNQPAIGPRRPCDMRQLQDVMAELHQSGTIDPAAEEQLAKDLQQSDPAIWPLVIQQCRATQAYRREAARRNGASDIVQRLPPTGGVPQDAYASTSPRATGDVMQASFSASLGEWRQRLNGAIEALEAETSANPPTPGDVTQEARLRLLYTVAGRREDAARPILDAAPAMQQFLSKEVEGLGVWLDAEHVPDPVRRTVEAKPALTAALAHLGETAPLMVRNASFCTEALGFGSFKKVEKYEFCQDQNVLLYAELENFSAEPVDKGFRTSLRSGYQILDHLGRQVAWHEFPPMQDFCKNVRRDFFIAYHLRLPSKMAPGKYLLRLVIQDTTRQKTGQASVEFTVKEGKAEDPKTKKQ
jgi:hypothetical protein